MFCRDIARNDKWKRETVARFPRLVDEHGFTIVGLRNTAVNCVAMALGLNMWHKPPRNEEEAIELCMCASRTW